MAALVEIARASYWMWRWLEFPPCRSSFVPECELYLHFTITVTLPRWTLGYCTKYLYLHVLGTEDIIHSNPIGCSCRVIPRYSVYVLPTGLIQVWFRWPQPPLDETLPVSSHNVDWQFPPPHYCRPSELYRRHSPIP